jgi:NADH dehydrogenase
MLNIPDSNRKRVVIIGGGFGGIILAKKLSASPYQVVLLDKHNYHTFQPRLYQVATAGLEPDSIAYPLRKIFSGQKEFYFRKAEVLGVNSNENCLETNIGKLQYDYLVVATDSKTNYFGNNVIEVHSMPMKTVPEALNLPSLILQNFEKALLTDDLKERERLMNYVIVGGGPTGVELAGALAELKNHVLPNDYPDLDIRRMTIHLVEAGSNMLGAMSDKSRKKSEAYFEKMGVHTWTDTMVESYDGKLAKTNRKDLQASTLIWAAGVAGSGIPGLEDHYVRGRYTVDEYNRVGGISNVFAIGDVAGMTTEDYPKGHPMVAPVAIQQGQLLAKNLKRIAQNKDLQAFLYKDKGSMATIGRNRAVVDINKLHFGGMFGWLVWMFVHLMSLVGFRNKVITLMNWLWSYVKYDKGVRLIIRPFNAKKL